MDLQVPPVFNEALTEARQKIPRAPRAAVTLLLSHTDFRTEEMVVDGAENISATGLFVRCDEPYTVGTVVGLQLKLPGTDGCVEALGCVVRVGLGASGHPGMGIMFTRLTGASRAMVERLVAAAAEPDER